MCNTSCCTGLCNCKLEPKTVPHKHAEVIKAWADGAEIEMAIYGAMSGQLMEWKLQNPPYWHQDAQYRVKPIPTPIQSVTIDPYAELKAAHRAGKMIQWKSKREGSDSWKDCGKYGAEWFSCNDYRIKPEPKPDVVKYTAVGCIEGGTGYHTAGCWSNKENIAEVFYGESKTPYYTVGKIKFTFDGETGVLKSVEKI